MKTRNKIAISWILVIIAWVTGTGAMTPPSKYAFIKTEKMVKEQKYMGIWITLGILNYIAFFISCRTV